MEHLLAATLALNTTSPTQPQKQAATVTVKDQQQDESQFEQPLVHEKWKLTVPFLMLGVC
jgi:hypothetical protein